MHLLLIIKHILGVSQCHRSNQNDTTVCLDLIGILYESHSSYSAEYGQNSFAMSKIASV